MKKSMSCVVVFVMAIAANSFAFEPTAGTSAKTMADCFAVCDSDECLGNCIVQRMSSGGIRLEAVDRETQVTDSFTDCGDPDCLRARIASYVATWDAEHIMAVPRNIESTQKAAADWVDCTVDAIDNVGTCANLFLVEGEEDYEGFWVCTGGAATAFLKCTGITSATSMMSGRETQFTLQLIVERGVAAINTFERTGITPQHTTGQSLLAQATFGECATDYRDNRQTCRNLFSNDPEALDNCLDGTNTVFSNCVGNIGAAAQ